MGFPGGSAGKESACNVGDLGLIPGWGRSPGQGKGYPLRYSGLENSVDYSPWGCKESDMTEQLSHLNNFRVASSVFSMQSIVSSQTRTVLLLPFKFGCFLF